MSLVTASIRGENIASGARSTSIIPRALKRATRQKRGSNVQSMGKTTTQLLHTVLLRKGMGVLGGAQRRLVERDLGMGKEKEKKKKTTNF